MCIRDSGGPEAEGPEGGVGRLALVRGEGLQAAQGRRERPLGWHPASHSRVALPAVLHDGTRRGPHRTCRTRL
eukprot:12360789-Alexandrium_andersonii.AAC.1